jgi:catalase
MATIHRIGSDIVSVRFGIMSLVEISEVSEYIVSKVYKSNITTTITHTCRIRSDPGDYQQETFRSLTICHSRLTSKCSRPAMVSLALYAAWPATLHTASDQVRSRKSLGIILYQMCNPYEMVSPVPETYLYQQIADIISPTAHAKGHLLTGTFRPTANASSLSSVPHFNASSTPITVRFSSSTGFPQIADTDPSANPRGIAIRFHLPEQSGRRHHTDIVAHSTKYFPTRTGAEFLEFLKAAGGPNAGEAVPEFLSRHPETVRFLQDPKPSPESFATEKFFGVNAFKFVKDGKATTFRYRIVPVAGEKHLDTDELKKKSDSYLFDEFPTRLESGPIEFKLLAQIAEADDVTDNATEIWPEERKVVELGTIKIEKTLSDDESLTLQKQIIFDPFPRVDGVEPSDDPLLEVRASIYLISGKQRRSAEESPKADDVEPTDAAKAAT